MVPKRPTLAAIGGTSGLTLRHDAQKGPEGPFAR
jgi:hypothetical protein